MNYLRDLIYRLRAGESERRIAEDLQVSRPTVHKYRLWAERQGYLKPEQPLPDLASLIAALGPVAAPPQMVSTLAPHQAVIEQLLDQGVEITAIWQRLKQDYSYSGSYSAVRRLVGRLRPRQPEVIVRVQRAPGEEMQVDFGSVGPLFDPQHQRPRPAYVFVATLSYSRHQYAEIVFDQKTPTWLALHRRAFESFGGVPRRVVPDNLKAAVLKALVDDPVLGEGYRRLALHYGFLINPTRPGTPEHKGKVENGIHYVQRNFMAGQQFVDSEAANARLQVWVRETAGARSHGTTRQAPLWLFQQYEQAALLPLPVTPFSLLEIKPVKVHPDCHVSLEGSYYSVPYRYIGQRLDAYLSEQLVELYQGVTLVASHVRCRAPGQWQTRLEDYPAAKVAYLMHTPQYCRQLADQIGPATLQVVETLLAEKPLERLRAVQHLLRLEQTVGRHRLEAACVRALHYGDIRFRRIQQILNAALDREPLPEDSAAVSSSQSFTFARVSQDFFPSEPEVPAC